MINYVYQLVSPQVFSIKYQEIGLDNDVIIKPRYMAICHADQRYYLGQRDTNVLNQKLPMALIHECCGEVVLDRSNTFDKGQAVVLVPNVPTQISDVIYENYLKGSYFLSSGHDGFMREFVTMPKERIVLFDNIPYNIAAISEFVSVCVHSANRFDRVAHNIRTAIGIWGDGSLAYVMACVLKVKFPKSKIVVVGKNINKLSLFSFVDETYIASNLPKNFEVDHAFECAGGEGSYFAIDDIIKYCNSQGSVMLMGVTENKVPINTRNILEKGLTFVGSSRSGKGDFEEAVKIMSNKGLQHKLNKIIYQESTVKSINDIHKVFATDLRTPFKTVFEWGL